METAFQLAAKSPLALEAAKEAINRALGGDHAENLAREADRFGELFASADAKGGHDRVPREARAEVLRELTSSALAAPLVERADAHEVGGDVVDLQCRVVDPELH